MNDLASAPPISASPLRRLGALLYDALIVVALQVVATVPFLPFIHDRVLIVSEVGALAYVYRLWQLVVVILFFGFFWARKGQTVGMQAWRLRIETLSGAMPAWRDAVLRVLLAALPWLPAFTVLTAADYLQPRKLLLQIGLGLLVLGPINYLIAYLDPQRRSWHDRFLRSRIVRRRQ